MALNRARRPGAYFHLEGFHFHSIRYIVRPDMMDARVEEIRKLLPQAMLPDWVRLGGRMVAFCVINIIRKRTTPF